MFGAINSKHTKKIMLLGAGELGKEVIIEAQRLGINTIAVDRYANAPAMQVAHKSYVVDMLDGQALKEIIIRERPDFIVPEIEAIATEMLVELEGEGFNIIPTANAVHLTMDREGIRRLASEKLNLPTAKYEFADSLAELQNAVVTIGVPCVIKPIMSSSGKGQSICRSLDDVKKSWEEAVEGGRGKKTRVIVEEFISFNSEITLLTVRSISGTHFCPPIGHIQKDGDYIESWQPHQMTAEQLEQSEQIAAQITDALGGYGLFGVELFLTDKGVYFSEVSPRPHDTGMVTLATQDLSEFALHIRAVLGLPIPQIRLNSPGASKTLKASRESADYEIHGVLEALASKDSQIRIFGKPNAVVGRRLAVLLQRGETAEAALADAREAHAKLSITYGKSEQ